MAESDLGCLPWLSNQRILLFPMNTIRLSILDGHTQITRPYLHPTATILPLRSAIRVAPVVLTFPA